MGGAAVGILGFSMGKLFIPDRKIPSTSEVDSNCIAPSLLEIKCKDLDGNGKPETIMNIDSVHPKSYILRWDDKGNPVLSPSEVKPTEIIYK